MRKPSVRYALQRPASSLHGLDTGNSQRRVRPRKSKDSRAIEIATPRVHQETVLAIPELLDLIAHYMARDNLQVAIRVCRAWYAFWVPHLYSAVVFRNYRRNLKYRNLWTYGEHVKSLSLSSAKWHSILYLLNSTPNIQSFTLHATLLTSAQLRKLTTVVPRLRFLHLHFSRSTFLPQDCPLAPIANLTNLEELSWEGCGGQARIDDLLLVLKSCSNLKTLAILSTRIVEELQDTKDDSGLVRVDDDAWENVALQSLHWKSVALGPRIPLQYTPAHPQPCIRRFFQHVPNLNAIKLSDIDTLSTLD